MLRWGYKDKHKFCPQGFRGSRKSMNLSHSETGKCYRSLEEERRILTGTDEIEEVVFISALHIDRM